MQNIEILIFEEEAIKKVANNTKSEAVGFQLEGLRNSQECQVVK